MQARDGLLTEEAALLKGDGRLDESDLGRHPALVDVVAEAHLAGLDAQRLDGGVGDRYRIGCHRGGEHASQLGRWHECINARQRAERRLDARSWQRDGGGGGADHGDQSPGIGPLDRRLGTQPVAGQLAHELVGDGRLHVEQHPFGGEPRDAQIGQDSRLRRQQQRAPGLAVGEAREVLGQQVLQKGLRVRPLDRDEGARGCEHAGGGAERGELLGGGGGHGVTCRFAHPAGPAAPYTLLGRLLCKLPQGKYCETENEFFGAV